MILLILEHFLSFRFLSASLMWGKRTKKPEPDNNKWIFQRKTKIVIAYTEVLRLALTYFPCRPLPSPNH